MNRKNIKTLAIASYSKGNLDKRIVNKIANLLSRKELRYYINVLKSLERKKTLIVSISTKKSFFKTELSKVYPGKKIIFEYDPSLLAGVRIINDDLIYEMSIKNTLERIAYEVDN